MEAVVASARVDTEPDGSLLVSWELAGDPVAVQLVAGPSPERLDRLRPITVAAGQTSWRLPRFEHVRCFVSVAPEGAASAPVVADRRIAFRGITNFRDLGGYQGARGAAVRWGLVFRADALAGLVPDDLRRYEQLGVRAVFDLRGDVERSERPNPMDSRHLSVLSRPADAVPAVVGASVADGERILADMYQGLIDHAAGQIGELFTSFGKDDGLPAVFHCHAGKDRTGVVAALLLEALGVDRAHILDDYELTGRYRRRAQQESTYARLLEAGLSTEAAAGVLSSPRWAMEEALDHLDTRHGGIEDYLTGPAGMDRRDLELLLDGLLEQRG